MAAVTVAAVRGRITTLMTTVPLHRTATVAAVSGRITTQDRELIDKGLVYLQDRELICRQKAQREKVVHAELSEPSVLLLVVEYVHEC